MQRVVGPVLVLLFGVGLNSHAADLELQKEVKLELYPMNAVHLSAANSIAVALGRTDTGEVEIRDLKTLEVKERLRGYGSYVYSVACSDSQQVVITGSADGAVRFWDLKQHSDRRFEKAHEGRVYAVAVSGNGRQVASAGTDKVVRIWSVEDGRIQRALAGHKDAVLCLTWSHDSRWIISGDGAGVCILWDAATFMQTKTFETDSGIPWQLTWDANTSSVWLGENGYGIKQLSVPEFEVVSQNRFNKSGIKAIALLPTARSVGVGVSKSILFHDLGIQTVTNEHEAHDRGIVCLIPLPENQLLSMGLDRRLRLWKTSLRP